MIFLWKWLRWLFGYSVFEIRGVYGEKFITLCMKEEIDFWEIRRICPGIIQVKVFLFAIKKLEPLARKSGVVLEFVKSEGFPVALKKYRFRYGLFLGVTLYLCSLFFLSQFVWTVEIPGANPVQIKQIRSVLLEEGFGIGSFIPSVNYRNLRYQLMLNQDNISFVSVNMEGCRAVVEVRFSQKTPELVDDGTPCNIVASRDGQIVSVLVRTGARYVQKGQTVQKGDLLIGGIMDTRLGYYVVHAKGKILARVTDIQSETVPLIQKVKERTGRYTVKRIWNFFGKEMDGSPWFSCPYNEFEIVTQTKYLSFGNGAEVPISLTEIYYYETTPHESEITLEEAKAIAINRMNEADRLRFYDIEVESVTETMTETPESVVFTRERSIIVDICEDKAFYFED